MGQLRDFRVVAKETRQRTEKTKICFLGSRFLFTGLGEPGVIGFVAGVNSLPFRSAYSQLGVPWKLSLKKHLSTLRR